MIFELEPQIRVLDHLEISNLKMQLIIWAILIIPKLNKEDVTSTLGFEKRGFKPS